jgi:hypothetical protein
VRSHLTRPSVVHRRTTSFYVHIQPRSADGRSQVAIHGSVTVHLVVIREHVTCEPSGLEFTRLLVVDDPRMPNALDVQTLHLDCGYDGNITTECYKTLGLTDIVCAKKRAKARPKITKPFTLGMYWPVERTAPGGPTSARSP